MTIDSSQHAHESVEREDRFSVSPPEMISPLDAQLGERLRLLEEAVTERVHAEQEFADQFGTAADAEQEALARNLAAVVQAQDHEESALRARFDQQRRAAETEHVSRKAEAERVVREAVARIQREARDETDRVTRQHEESRWVATSVLDETAEESPKRQFDRIRAGVDKTRIQQQAECAALDEAVRDIAEAHDWSTEPADVPVVEARDLEAFAAEFHRAAADARDALVTYRRLTLPRLFQGWRPLVAFVVMVAVCGIVASLLLSPSWFGLSLVRTSPQWQGIAWGASTAVSAVLLVVLYAVSSRQRFDAFARLRDGAAAAGVLHQHWAHLALQELQLREREYESHRKQRGLQLERQLDRYDVVHQQTLAEITSRTRSMVEALQSDFATESRSLDAERDRELAEMDRQFQDQQTHLTQDFVHRRTSAQAALDGYLTERDQLRQQSWSHIATDWFDRVAAFEQFAEALQRESQTENRDWNELADLSWRHPRTIPSAIRIGEFAVDLADLDSGVPSREDLRPPRTRFVVPARLPFPGSPSLLLETKGVEGRREAVHAMQAALLRMLTLIPPGKLRLTVLDPMGLGESFSGLMHLADFDELLITSRIWTETGHIDARLAELTEHMENVLQKYLRNEFATIEEYNQFAGEVAEPYRVLVVADFPSKFSEQAARRLMSIAASGPRCGVYLLMSVDRTATMPNAFDLSAIEASANAFVWRSRTDTRSTPLLTELPSHDAAKTSRKINQFSAFYPKARLLGRWPLTVDAPPPPDLFTQIVKNVGEASKDVRRVEVSFSRIAPKPEEVWTKDSRSGIDIPLGRAGATKLQHLRLGKGTSQHMLVAGKTGSGKSTFFHTLITNVALYYSPEEVELYLVDFKKGVEFKAYAPSDRGERDERYSIHDGLPHARVIAIESDREFGVSVLQRLDAILNERGELFRRVGVQDIAGYRDRVQGSETSAQRGTSSATFDARRSTLESPLPRILLVIDEFQEFFVEDDRYSQQAALLLDRLVRQGRAFGVHVILGSQTLGGAYSLARSTLGQVAVRVALQCSDADAHLILSEDNTAARLLTRPGEAIYNDANGLVEGNHPFQIAWLPDEERAGYLGVIQHFARERGFRISPPIIFEGNVPSDPARNLELTSLVAGVGQSEWAEQHPEPVPLAPRMWLGESVDIGPPTSVSFPPQSGANVLIVGADASGATGILTTALIALAAQRRCDAQLRATNDAPGAGLSSDDTMRSSNRTANFFVFDGSPPGSVESEVWKNVAAAIGSDVRLVTPQTASEAIEELASERRRRDTALGEGHVPLFLLIAGVSKFRDLRKSDDDFSLSGFGASSEDAAPATGRMFADLLAEGPPLGMHTLLWADSYSNVDRWLSRQSLREFELRVAFPMNAADSSNLIDSPAASRLGVHRALLYREETGAAAKFRPYGLPTPAWLDTVRDVFETHQELEVVTDLEGFHIT
ncbi:MAG: hypothetical protein KF861_04010 [Planctomycetaceae bacterium]|nr:hypothetical protein [Planctomycetaceae bacterium]